MDNPRDTPKKLKRCASSIGYQGVQSEAGVSLFFHDRSRSVDIMMFCACLIRRLVRVALFRSVFLTFDWVDNHETRLQDPRGNSGSMNTN